jgi:multiple sugar transport system substrate-binding protein
MMTKRQTRIHPISRFLILTLLLGMLLAACGPAASTTPTPTGEETEAIETPAATQTPEPTAVPVQPEHLSVDEADLAGVVVRVVHPWVGVMADELNSQAMQFSLSNEWDIWVEMDPMGSESMVVEGLQADVIQQTLPGIVISHPYWLESLNGRLPTVNLADYVNDPTWGLSVEAQTDIPEVFLSPYLSDGQLTGLPIAPQATLLFYNQTWLQELGLSSFPENAADLEKALCDAAFENNSDEVLRNDGTGGWLVNLAPNVLLSWFTAFGGPLDANTLPEFNNDAGQEAFGFLEELRIKGCAWESVNTDPYEYFTNRYAVMFAGDTSQIPTLQNWMASAGSEDLWTVTPFVGTSDSPVLVDGPAMMMTETTPEIQMAGWLFMKYLLSPEVQAKLVQAGYSLPVRASAMDQLTDFAGQNPVWAQAYQYALDAEAAPASADWGIKQWVLQDAVHRLLQLDVDDEIKPADVLQEVDAALEEMEGTRP